MRRIYFWLLIVYLSSKWIFRVNLGDKVTYKNHKTGTTYIVNNGVCPESWQLINRSCDERIDAPRKDCKKIKTIPNLIHSFKSGYNFYMTSWFSIWCDNGIEPWMKRCRIW